MSLVIADTANSLYTTVTNTSQQVELDTPSSGLYRFVSTVACWITQGADPTATAGAGSKFCGASEVVDLSVGHGAKVAVLRASGDGDATLTPITIVR